MLVLLLGEIDLSVGSVSGFTSAIMAVLLVNEGQSMLVVAILAAMAAGVAIGALYAVLYTGSACQLRLLARRAARLPGRAALRAGRPGHHQPARPTRSCVQFARFKFLSPRGVLRPGRGDRRSLYVGSQLLDEPAAVRGRA